MPIAATTNTVAALVRPRHSALRVQDQPRAEEADALHDVRGDLALVRCRGSGEHLAHDGEQRRTHTDEHVGAEAGVLMSPLALETNGAAQSARHQQAPRRRAAKLHLLRKIYRNEGRQHRARILPHSPRLLALHPRRHPTSAVKKNPCRRNGTGTLSLWKTYATGAATLICSESSVSTLSACFSSSSVLSSSAACSASPRIMARLRSVP